MKLFLMASVLVLLTSIIGCDQWDQKLTLTNSYPKRIFVAVSLDGIYKKHPIWLSEGDTLWTNIRYINPMESITPSSIEGITWEETINEECRDSTLTIFVFDEDLLKRVSRDSLLEKQLYTSKLLYKVKDLQKVNWHVELK